MRTAIELIADLILLSGATGSCEISAMGLQVSFGPGLLLALCLSNAKFQALQACLKAVHTSISISLSMVKRAKKDAGKIQ